MSFFSNEHVSPPSLPLDEQGPGRDLADVVRDRLRDVFPSRVERALRRKVQDSRRAGPNTIDEIDVPAQARQVHLLAGETGLGKSTVLRELGERASGLVIALSRPDELDNTMSQLARATSRHRSDIEQAARWVLVRTASEADAGKISVLRERFSNAVIWIACAPRAALDLQRHLGERVVRWMLQPLDDVTEKAAIWSEYGGEPSALLLWAEQNPAHLALTGNPLFLQIAAQLGLPRTPPRLPLVLARYIESVLAQEAPKVRAPLDWFLLALSGLSLQADGGSLSHSNILELREKNAAACERLDKALGSMDAALRRLQDRGLLAEEKLHWYRFRHASIAIVVVAQHWGQKHREALPAIARLDSRRDRELALLIPAFAPNGLDTLEHMTGGDGHLWLQGVADLPVEELQSHRTRVLRRFKEVLFRSGSARGADALKHRVEEIGESLGNSRMLGLLTALVALQPGEPDLLGALLYFMEQQERLQPVVRTLIEKLLADLPKPPPLPSVHRVGDFAIATEAVSNEAFARAFAEAATPDPRSQGPQHPVTGISWLAARAYAKWWGGGRLPTRAEWERVALRIDGRSLTERQANVPKTNRRVTRNRGGTIEVSQALPDSPGPGACRHLWGNVREWCEDGPDEALEYRWTMGGSYKFPPGDAAAQEVLHTIHSDVGFRLCWPFPLPVECSEDRIANQTSGAPIVPSRRQEVLVSNPSVVLVPQRIFISYSHDSSAHRERVLALADRFRADGMDAWIDQYETAPAQGWPRWMTEQFERAQFILLVCTPAYKRRFDGQEKSGKGKGVSWEGLLAQQIIYENRTHNEKFIPVLFDGEDEDAVPILLRPYQHYRLPSGYETLCRLITRQPAVVPPPVGRLRVVPPSNGAEGISQPVVQARGQLHSSITPKPAHSAGANEAPPITLSTAQQDQLIELLLGCGAVQNQTIRDKIVARLGSSIAPYISRHGTPKVDVCTIVESCAAREHGIEQLIEAIGWFEGKTRQMQAIDDFIHGARRT